MKLFFGAPVAGAVSGTLAATDSPDTAALAGNVLVQGSLAATDGADSASISGAVLVQGALAATDGVDICTATGEVLVQGALAANDPADVVSVAGHVIVQGALIAEETGQDTASFLGAVYSVAPSASSVRHIVVLETLRTTVIIPDAHLIVVPDSVHTVAINA